MPFRPSRYIEEQDLLDDVTTHIVSQQRLQPSLLPHKNDGSLSVNSSIESLPSRKLLQPVNPQGPSNPLGQPRKSSTQS